MFGSGMSENNRKMMIKGLKNIGEHIDSDELLESLGLRRADEGPSWIWPAVGGIGIGILCGMAIGMAFAPKRGTELRHDIADKIRRRDYEGLGRQAREMVNETRGSTPGSAGRGNVII